MQSDQREKTGKSLQIYPLSKLKYKSHDLNRVHEYIVMS